MFMMMCLSFVDVAHDVIAKVDFRVGSLDVWRRGFDEANDEIRRLV